MLVACQATMTTPSLLSTRENMVTLRAGSSVMLAKSRPPHLQS